MTSLDDLPPFPLGQLGPHPITPTAVALLKVVTAAVAVRAMLNFSACTFSNAERKDPMAKGVSMKKYLDQLVPHRPSHLSVCAIDTALATPLGLRQRMQSPPA